METVRFFTNKDLAVRAALSFQKLGGMALLYRCGVIGMTIFLGCAILIVNYGVYAFIQVKGPGVFLSNFAVVVIGILLGWIGALVIFKLIEKRNRDACTALLSNWTEKHDGERTLELAEERLRYTSPYAEHAYVYSYIHRVIEFEGFVFIVSDLGLIVWLPVSSFDNVDTMRDWISALNKKST